MSDFLVSKRGGKKQVQRAGRSPAKRASALESQRGRNRQAKWLVAKHLTTSWGRKK
jgi:hypothetical protein